MPLAKPQIDYLNLLADAKHSIHNASLVKHADFQHSAICDAIISLITAKAELERRLAAMNQPPSQGVYTKFQDLHTQAIKVLKEHEDNALAAGWEYL